jgi:hypothetical protein
MNIGTKSDGQGTTAMRNTLDITSLSSWMVCQSVLVHLLSIDTNVNDYYAGSSCRVSLDDARSLSREQWLKERLHVRQFGFGQSNPSNRSSSSSDTIKSDDDDDGGVVYSDVNQTWLHIQVRTLCIVNIVY